MSQDALQIGLEFLGEGYQGLDAATNGHDHTTLSRIEVVGSFENKDPTTRIDVIDILVQPRRDRRAAKRFFRKLLKSQGSEPRRHAQVFTTRLSLEGIQPSNVLNLE